MWSDRAVVNAAFVESGQLYDKICLAVSVGHLMKQTLSLAIGGQFTQGADRSDAKPLYFSMAPLGGL
ncbi:hypothetical protein Acife_1623 [Acidithiobacillus ferrivorans SS3]|uniref:Uncharacterized protein n=1 Tax=Acidithiobacillus ferrivorans SS3 TaxID=743299 RepID=G0JSW1_9PROT|nr:hypothetical protein Acife_1623 [Acidithiobacillus ferrivorans SS3]